MSVLVAVGLVSGVPASVSCLSSSCLPSFHAELWELFVRSGYKLRGPVFWCLLPALLPVQLLDGIGSVPT